MAFDYFNYLDRYATALEVMSDFDDYEDSALENINRDLEKTEENYSAQYAQVIAKFQSAIDSGDKNNALKALDEMDELLANTLQEMQELPQDKFIGVRKIAKIVLAVAGAYLMIRSGKVVDMGKNILAKTPLPGIVNRIFGRQVAKVPSKVAKFGAKAAKFGAEMVVGDIGFKGVMKGGKEIMAEIKAGSRKDFEEKYGKNPNAASGFYRKFYLALQAEKSSIPQLKQEVNAYFASK